MWSQVIITLNLPGGITTQLLQMLDDKYPTLGDEIGIASHSSNIL